MKSWKKLRVVSTCAALAATAFAGVIAAPEVGANPAKIPDGAQTFTIMGGNIAFGTASPGAISQALGHPDQPAQCQDGVDNEAGAYHNGFQGGNSANPPNPAVPATDGRVDFGAGATNETSATGCISLTDNLELFDRTSMLIDPAPTCGSGAQGFTERSVPGCASATGDSLSLSSALTLQKGSVTFANGNATTGQERLISKAGPGTVAGSAISVPQAAVQFARGYQAQNSCTLASGFSICLDLYVEFRVIPQASGITGVTNADGSGTVSGNIRIGLNITSTYDSGQIQVFLIGNSPRAATCTSSADIALAMTTGTSGTQTGVLYDDVRQNFKVVQDGLNWANFTGTNYGGTLANLCDTINTTIGLPDNGRSISTTATAGSATLTSAALFAATDVGRPVFGAGIPAGAVITAFATTSSVTMSLPATATSTVARTLGSKAKIGLIMSTQTTSNSAGSTATGTGMAATADMFRPASVTQVGVNNGALGAPQKANNTVNVNEGDIVAIDGAQSYDPAMRAMTTNALARTGGTAAAPPATTSTATNNVKFVAQDAPAAGATHIYAQTTSALLGPATQAQNGLVNQTINVQNVAPVANAGPAFTATGGQNFTLKGSSTDPGDPDTVAARGYCWTRTAGIGPVPAACAGTPLTNGKNLTLLAPNSNGTSTYSLTVRDKDGGVSVASTVVVTFRTSVAGTISGIANENGVGTAGITVNLYRTSTGFIGTTTSGVGGAYSFASLAAANDYIVLFSKAGDTSEWYNRAALSGQATKIDTTTGGKSIIDGFLVTNANTGTIATNVKDVAGNVVGTSVRLYDETGFVRAATSDGVGNASFAGLPPKSTYRVRFGLGSATHAELWAYTGGNTVGTAGTGGWTGNEAAKFTVTSGGTTNVNGYLFANNVAANALGNVTGTTNGPGGAVNGVEVRLYDNASGAFVAKAVTGKTISVRSIVNGTAGTFSFNPNQTLYGSGTVLDPSEPFNQLGVRPGDYKVWLRNPSGIVSGANPVCSTWANGGVASFVIGNQFQGSGKLVSPVTVTSGGTLAFGTVALTTAVGCS